MYFYILIKVHMNTKKLLKAFNDRNKNTLMQTLDIEYVAIGEDYLTAKMPVSSKVHQPYGQLHGGATAALAETVGSAASNFFIDSKNQFINGIQLSINHIKSKRDGVVYATAKNIHKGKSTHVWEVTIVDESEKLVSVAKMTNIVLEKK